MLSLFSKLKILLLNIKKETIITTLKYLVYCKIDQSMASTRPIHMYVGVAVLLLHFQ